jgi:putative acetyltransferase
MVILIGGESHTGKTLMAQRLLEKHHITYTSLDHIKMGLIRGYDSCKFTAIDDDDIISEKMWGIVKGIINTCLENNQNIILEGYYLPPQHVNEVLSENVVLFYIVFSENYIRNYFNDILLYESIIEQRKFPEEISLNDFILENKRLKESCLLNNLKFFEIFHDYNNEIGAIYKYIATRLSIKLRKYCKNDIDAIAKLFYNTVHSVNAKDYTEKQLNVWATGQIDKSAWNKSFLTHYTIIAEYDGIIVGFGDIDGDYLDRLYVHKDYQGNGIATAIIENLERYAFQNKKVQITTHASITAKPFFEKQGYKIIEKQQVNRDGVLLTNFIMKKKL